ncbi:MAG TPA: hypothetical protein VLA46_07175, partial [Saprospiraceae bacterium]|nr:hypothetical protein [Saprospiraceae bacterium]
HKQSRPAYEHPYTFYQFYPLKTTLKMIRLILVLILSLQWIPMWGQSEHFNYLKIGLTSESSPIAEMMKGNYEKEFYYNQTTTVYIKRVADNFELHFYDSSKKLTQIYLQVNKQPYVWDQPTLIDENYNELTDEQKLEFPGYYTISRDITKRIEGFDCFKVVLKAPEDTEGSAAVEMYVTESLPNFPNHFPLSSAILSAEPLEFSMNLGGVKITFGIVSHESGVNMMDQLGLAPDKAIRIDQDKYDELRL